MDPLRNARDPMHDQPDAGKELFRHLSRVSAGFPTDVVIAAAVNILVNAVRQSHPSRNGAARAFDELAARAKALLLEQHYDASGRRRNVFPFHQVISVPFLNLKNKA